MNSDVVGCIRYETGETWVIDTWNPDSQRTSVLDATQIDMCIHSMLYHNGRLHCRYVQCIAIGLCIIMLILVHASCII